MWNDSWGFSSTDHAAHLHSSPARPLSSSSFTKTPVQTCLPFISPSLYTHVACIVGAELISFQKHPHKLPRGNQMKSPVLHLPALFGLASIHLCCSSARSDNPAPLTLPCCSPRTKPTQKHSLDSVPRTALPLTGFSLHTLWFGLWI